MVVHPFVYIVGFSWLMVSGGVPVWMSPDFVVPSKSFDSEFAKIENYWIETASFGTNFGLVGFRSKTLRKLDFLNQNFVPDWIRVRL